jgi:GDP-D-mannose dehydratase
MSETPDISSFEPREILLAAAARAVLAAFREPLEQLQLSSPATATLRLLETALEPYRFDPPSPLPPPFK